MPWFLRVLLPGSSFSVLAAFHSIGFCEVPCSLPINLFILYEDSSYLHSASSGLLYKGDLKAWTGQEFGMYKSKLSEELGVDQARGFCL